MEESLSLDEELKMKQDLVQKLEKEKEGLEIEKQNLLEGQTEEKIKGKEER